MPNQSKMKLKHQLVPDAVYLIPYENIASKNRNIFSMRDVNKNNAIIVQQPTESTLDADIVLSEESITVTSNLTDENISTVTPRGAVPIDSITNSESSTIEMAVNGISQDIEALIEGRNPLIDFGQALFAFGGRNDSIDTIIITSAGTGYTDGTYDLVFDSTGAGVKVVNPTTEFIEAKATATVEGGEVKKINIIHGGANYASVPTVTLPTAAGGGTGDSYTLTLGNRNQASVVTNRSNIDKQFWFVLIKSELLDTESGYRFDCIPKCKFRSEDNSKVYNAQRITRSLQADAFAIMLQEEMKRLSEFNSVFDSGNPLTYYYWTSNGIVLPD